MSVFIELTVIEPEGELEPSAINKMLIKRVHAWDSNTRVVMHDGTSYIVEESFKQVRGLLY